MNFPSVDYADCSQSMGIYGKVCLNKFSMSHVYRKTRVPSKVIKSRSKLAKIGENEQKSILT